jgi:hypothetical protein
MAKRKVTVKDIRYALQFGGERLIKTFSQDGRRGIQYSLSPSGRMLDGEAMRFVLSSPNIVAVDDGLLPGISQTFIWQEVA